MLTTPERKIELLREAGAKRLLIIPFDREFSKIEPEAFVETVLGKHLKASVVVVGANFRFGRMARGDFAMLKSMGRSLGFQVEAMKLKRAQSRTVSSTAIRHAIETGDVAWAKKALGRPHLVQGVVVEGAGRGRELGFPTANLEVIEATCVPAEGVYAGRMIDQDGQPHDAAISVGTNPTFGDNSLTIEPYLLDFQGSLYGQHAGLEFVARLRDQQRFTSAAQLQTAIERDVVATRKILKRDRR